MLILLTLVCYISIDIKKHKLLFFSRFITSSKFYNGTESAKNYSELVQNFLLEWKLWLKIGSWTRTFSESSNKTRDARIFFHIFKSTFSLTFPVPIPDEEKKLS